MGRIIKEEGQLDGISARLVALADQMSDTRLDMRMMRQMYEGMGNTEDLVVFDAKYEGGIAAIEALEVQIRNYAGFLANLQEAYNIAQETAIYEAMEIINI